MLKYLTLILLLAAVMQITANGQTPATQPAPSVAEIELRATQAFTRGDYAVALPLLQKVVVQLKDQPERLGPLQEMIRVAQRNIAVNSARQSAVSLPPEVLAAAAKQGADDPANDPPSAPGTRKPHAAPEAGKVRDLSIKELGNFEYDAEKGGNIPDDVKKLTGSTIRLHGYMLPMDQADRITRFALVPSLFACCFGQPPQVQHTIVVDCPPGKAVGYFPDEIVVEGTLTVAEKKEDDIILSVFEMKTTSVKPAAK